MAAAIVLAAPVPAQASQVLVETIGSSAGEGDYVVFKADAGERNRVRVRYTRSGRRTVRVRVQDSAGVTARRGCRASSRTVAVCRVRRTEFGDQWELGNRNDTLTLDGHPRGREGPSILDGSGNDVVRGSRGRDSFFDGSGRDRHYGRGGNDTLYSGAGPDTLSGGAGKDTVSYDSPLGASRRSGVRADLDGKADDGASRERDRIRPDVENLEGTRFADVLRGNRRANEIDGGGGADRIFGYGANDLITATTSAIIAPGSGADRIQGGRRVNARDGRRDRISSCGVAIADRHDIVRGCRRVRRG